LMFGRYNPNKPIGWFTGCTLIGVMLVVLFVLPIQSHRGSHGAIKRDLQDVSLKMKNANHTDIQKYLVAKSKGKFDYWKEAAEEGLSQGQALLGLCYFYGAFVPQDKEKAMKLLITAAQGCSVPAAPFLEMGEENIPAEGQ